MEKPRPPSLLSQKLESAKKKRKKGEEVAPAGLRSVPSSFSGMEEYLAVYEPLLLEECRAQILRGQEDAGGAAAHRARILQSEAANQFTFVKLQVDEQVQFDLRQSLCFHNRVYQQLCAAQRTCCTACCCKS